MFDLINLGGGSGGYSHSSGQPSGHSSHSVPRQKPGSTIESKAVNALDKVMDSRSFDPALFAYLLESSGGEASITFFKVIEAFLVQMEIRFEGNTSRSLAEEAAGVKAKRLIDSSRRFTV